MLVERLLEQYYRNYPNEVEVFLLYDDGAYHSAV